MNQTTKEIGDNGEDLAAAYLESKGWTLLDRNYSFMKSELDIVAYDQKEIVFVEVKFRSDDRFGHPREMISDEKIRHLYKAAEAWLYERRMEGSPTRFDVIAILQKGNTAPEFTHIRDAIH